MGDQSAKGEEFEKNAENKLNSWNFFGSKYEDAADLFEKAANFFKLAKSWDRAGSIYVKLANCHLKLESQHEAAQAYAQYGCKEIAELYETEQNIEQAMDYYEKAADFFQSEEVSTSANQCKQKIAQFAAQIEQYQKAIEIYEDIARQEVTNNLLKYGVKGHLLNAGICQLCKGDVVAITNALERYQDLDQTFSGTRECRLLTDIASAMDEEDITKFTDALKEFDSMTPLDSWKTTLLLRVKEKLKAKELEEDDLT
ncbi:Alpha-soluble NSF attachment protein [Hibiscus syriacus]|uniref:Alpha-soluble NSF attachment protein n=1 Tax=Hibiscus syriacus TaxID=106335 RepID=A0A6A3A6S1_HIBSY|nr:Alpha-soluble NSF attachment protein [Hibiscus syriacus]